MQEKTLDALIAYLQAADADTGRYAKEVYDTIVAKCLTGRLENSGEVTDCIFAVGGVGSC